MSNNKNRILFLFTLCFLSFGCGANNENSWTLHCEQAKERFSKQNNNNLTYTPLPIVKKNESFWLLNWSGYAIPIPDVKYKDILINTENNDDTAIILVTENDMKIIIGRVYGNDEITSLFEITGEQVSKEDVEWTKSAFDMPIRTSDLLDLGYQITLNNVDCNTDNQARESAKLASLVLKNTVPAALAVHKLNLKEKNWVTASQYGKSNKIYSINIVDEKRNSDEIKQISYIVQDDISNFNLYAGVTSYGDNADNPLWLNSLNIALENKKISDWDTYFEKASKVGISQKSIDMSKAALINQ